MSVIHLTKKFRLVWNSNNEIIINDEFPANTETGCLSNRGFESDNKEEIDDKIQELGLIEIENNEL